MTRYKRWMDRESDNILPYTVIIDKEEMWIQEISPAESKQYGNEQNKGVNNAGRRKM